jgi:hypothetical protein
MSTTSEMMKKGEERSIPIAGSPVLKCTKITQSWPQQQEESTAE